MRDRTTHLPMQSVLGAVVRSVRDLVETERRGYGRKQPGRVSPVASMTRADEVEFKAWKSQYNVRSYKDGNWIRVFGDDKRLDNYGGGWRAEDYTPAEAMRDAWIRHVRDAEAVEEMAATYVDISREEFEKWLDEVWGTGNWNARTGSVGVYRLKLSPKASIEVSSSIGRADKNLGVGEAAIHVRMVSRRFGHVLNRKAIGKSRINRTKGWKGNLLKAFEDLRAAYEDSPYFYDAIAEPDAYKADTVARIERIKGWAEHKFLKSIRDQVAGGSVLTPAQRQFAADLESRFGTTDG